MDRYSNWNEYSKLCNGLNIYGYIYLIENLWNKKMYVGKSINPSKRLSQHLRDDVQVIDKAIFKYTKENFDFLIIDVAFSEEELNDREIYWIRYYDTYNNGYNLTIGGEGVAKNQAIVGMDICSQDSIDVETGRRKIHLIFKSCSEASLKMNCSTSEIKARCEDGYFLQDRYLIRYMTYEQDILPYIKANNITNQNEIKKICDFFNVPYEVTYEENSCGQLEFVF